MTKILFFVLILFSTTNSFAFFTEIYMFSGIGKASLANESDSPDMFAHAIGTTMAFDVLAGVHVGVSADYRFYNQRSNVEDPFGNRTGTRLALSPTIAYSVGTLVLKYMYQMNGDYELKNETSDGDKVTYSDVSGHSFFASIPYSTSLRIGLFYEIEKFETATTGATKSDLAANNNELQFDKYGLYLSVIF